MTIARDIFLISILCAFVVGLICAAPTTSPSELANGTEANDSNVLPDHFYGKYVFYHTANSDTFWNLLSIYDPNLIQKNMMIGFERNEDTRFFNIISNSTEYRRADNLEIGKPFGEIGSQMTFIRKNDSLFVQTAEISIEGDYLVLTFHIPQFPSDDQPKLCFMRYEW